MNCDHLQVVQCRLASARWVMDTSPTTDTTRVTGAESLRPLKGSLCHSRVGLGRQLHTAPSSTLNAATGWVFLSRSGELMRGWIGGGQI